jgi:tRNA (guanine37-N1)-methyltransferase
MMRFDVLTLFPEMFTGPLQESIIKRAQERGLISIHLHNIRDYATGRHRITDDTPYGGGGGMVMKPEPIFAAVEAVLGDEKGVPVILLSPQGRLFTHTVAKELSRQRRLVLICGRYEGVDERVREHLATDEISIGDYVLSGGELAAMVIIDAVSRLLPGVLGDPGATFEDSYAWGLLEYPHYTRPAVFRGWGVPEVLLSGNHAAIARWRREQALRRTLERRPDLLERAALTEEDRAFLARLGWRRTPEGDTS